MTSGITTNWPISQIEPFLNYLIVECGLADNTIKSYRRDLKRFTAYCIEHSIAGPAEITPVIIQGYARFLVSQKLATATIARHVVAVRMFLRFHLLFGLADKDVCSALETPKTWQLLPRVISQKQTTELVNAPDPKSPLYLRDRAILELLYATGIRATEAACITVKDINFQIGYLRCVGKGNKERIVPVHGLALNVIKQYITELRNTLTIHKDCPQLFVSRTGRPLSRIEIWRIVRRSAMRAGLTGKITPHTLRHCFGTHLLQGGADLRTVQEMLGHADVTTTQIYTHIDHEQLRDVHKKYHPRP